MEDSRDVDMFPPRPQNYLFSSELKADKDCHFKVDNDENDHQLSLRTVSLGAGAKDELHIVEAEAMNYGGSPIKVALTTLTMSVQPMGFEITPPVLLRLKCGSGPVHISGHRLVAGKENAESEDEEEEEDVKLLSTSGKLSAPAPFCPQKKIKLATDEDDDEADDDENDDFDEEETEEKTPVKKGQKSYKKQEETPKTPK
ncbi:nucleophosmin-like [Piliocolobus tephrosceles]|uniref:nucleophosmin-like n=1 Tax=Piliocolobus tephrosceles TaxID=591936 RepID=UPI000C29F094|nr:nucleophosmin-like [Piliocolobus tephrosceles]